MSDEGSIDVMDFHFHGLQKSRLTSKSSNVDCCPSIVVSSEYQIGICCSGNDELTSFSTSVIPSLNNPKDQNTEFTGIERKSHKFDVLKIHALSMNPIGSLLACLVSTTNGCFVHIYDVIAFSPKINGTVKHISAIRLGADPSATGLALEWNPADDNVLAASSSEKYIVVVKLNPADPSKVTFASKQLAEAAVVISWSPKGKQLVVGDASASIVQLKPELDIVRTTKPNEVPGIGNNPNIRMCGLCWLATTDWFVCYHVQGQPDLHAFVLRILKNKAPEYSPLTDLSYCNPSSTLNQRVYSDCSLLLSWNVVFLSSARSSEILVLGKREETWKIWTLDDCSRYDLPLTSGSLETFPLGTAVDLSSSTPVVINNDKKWNPSPILMVFTTDGVLTANNVINENPSATSVQKQALGIDVSKARGVVAEAPKTVMPSEPAKVQASTLGQTSFFSQNTEKPKPSLFQQPAPAPSIAVTAPTPPATVAPTPVVQPPPPESPKVTAEMKAAQEAKLKEQALKEATQSLVKSVTGLDNEWREWSKQLDLIRIGLQDAKPKFDNFEISDESEVLMELKKMVEELTESMEGIERTLKRGFASGAEKMEIVDFFKDSKTSLLKRLKDTDDFDREERMRNVVKKYDDIKEKYAEAKKLLDKTKKCTVNKSIRLIPSQLAEDKLIQSQTRSINKAMSAMRWKLDTLEDEVLKINNKYSLLEKKKNGEATKGLDFEVKVLDELKLPDAGTVDVNVMRQLMLQTMSQKVTIKPRHIVSLPFANQKQQIPVAAKTHRDDLRESLLNKSFSQKPSEKSSLDAATQADFVSSATQSNVQTKASPSSMSTPVSKVLGMITNNMSANKAPMPQPVFTNLSPERPSKPIGSSTPFSTQPKQPTPVKEPPPTTAAIQPPADVTVTQTIKLFPQKAPLSATNNNTPTTSVEKTPVEEKPKEVVAPVSEPPKLPEPVKESTKITTKAESYSPASPTKSIETTEENKEKESATEKPKSIFGGGFGTKSKDEAEKSGSDEKAAESTPPAKSSIFGQTQPSTTTNTPTPATPSTSNSSVFGNSIFGSGNQTTPKTPSIFGTQSPASSGFGAFGTKTEESKPTTGAAAFSFTKAEPAKPTASAFSFAPKPASTGGSGFAAAAAAKASDGMMEEDMGDEVTSGSSGGFMSSLSLGGSSNASNNTNKSIFGGNTGSTTSNNASSFLFKKDGATTQSSGSSFGSFAAAASAAAGTAKPTSSIFGGNAPKFGGAPAFGGAPSFGGSSAFGSKPVFGGAPAFGSTTAAAKPSVFGGGTTSSTQGGFASFSGGSSGFGNAAAAKTGGSSIFGGGASQQPAQTSSIFGGGQNKSSFNTWR